MLGIQSRRLRGVAAAAITFVIGLLVVPVAAQAGLGANASIRFSPDVVRVGGSGTGEITLTNGNDAADTAATNTVCNAGDPCPTAAATETQGISVIASCQALGSGTTCPAAAADPDVFALSPTATGAALSACATTIFDVVKVADTPTDFGRWRFTPRPGASQVQLPGTGATCRIAFTYSVLKAPRDANPATPELETIQFTFHSQANATVSPLLSASVRSSATQIILRAAPTIATVASANVTVGGQITDTATVSGRVNPVAGATVQFTAYGPNDAACTTSVFTSTVAISAGGTATSAPFTPSTAGVYRWRAIYSGDANNDPAAGACNDPGESVAVSALPLPPPPPPPPAPPPPPPPPAAPVLASPTISTVASSDVVVGGQITDTATVSGLVNPEPGLKVVFRLYGPDDASCATSIDLSTGVLSAAGIARSEPFTVTKAGVYRWRAFYLGDNNNNPVSGACNDPRETVTVTESAITSVTFDTPPVVGETTFLNIVAIDPSQPVSGVQVNYGEGGARSGSTACATPAVRKTAPKRGKHTRLRVPYAFKRAGKHRVKVKVLSGACGKPRKTKTKTVTVTVKGRRKATKPRVATGGCKDRFLVPTAATRPRVAAAVLCLVNVERRKHGRKPLRRSARLTTVALKQSTDMLRRKYFAHEAPNGPQFTTRLRRDGYRGVTAAENIAYGSDFTPQLVVRTWMNSPEHRANILHPRLKFAGVGLVIGIPDTPPLPGSTYTMNFGGTST